MLFPFSLFSWEAIVPAKGFKKGGSYRNIQLTRNEENAGIFPIKHGDVVEVKSSMVNKPMITGEGAVNGKPSTGKEPRKIQDKLAVFEIPSVHGIIIDLIASIVTIAVNATDIYENLSQ
jgi:hypothetical protein